MKSWFYGDKYNDESYLKFISISDSNNFVAGTGNK